MKKKTKVLVIDRKRWLRGEGYEKSALYRSRDRKMCCLGSAARQLCGARVADIHGCAGPSIVVKQEVADGFRRLGLMDAGHNTGICHDLMSINDDTSMNSRDRENQLKRLFALIDVAVKFIN
jgi:hypothetical protein